jgi:cytochrome c oxidase subunit 4
MMSEEKRSVHVIGFGLFAAVWLGLLALTALTIYVAGLHLGPLSTGTTILIAAVKTSLVLLFFMHLRYEPPIFKITALVTLGTLTTILLLTFTDVWFR